MTNDSGRKNTTLASFMLGMSIGKARTFSTVLDHRNFKPVNVVSNHLVTNHINSSLAFPFRVGSPV